MPIVQEVLKHLLECREWFYVGGSSLAIYNKISCTCPRAHTTGHFDSASVVFEGLGLSLATLREIFPTPVHEIPHLSPYEELGGSHRGNEQGFRRFAWLVNHAIHYVLFDITPGGNVMTTIAVYYPDGQVVRLQAIKKCRHPENAWETLMAGPFAGKTICHQCRELLTQKEVDIILQSSG